MGVQDNIDRGKAAIAYFHNRALRYPQNYKLTLVELYSRVSAQNALTFENLGFAIGVAGMGEGAVQAAMEELADSGRGRLPSSFSGWFNALQGQASKTTFLGAASAVAVGTAKELASGLANAGNVVISTLDTAGGLVRLLPYVGFAFIAFYLYERGKK